jgi:hypothetical protein
MEHVDIVRYLHESRHRDALLLFARLNALSSSIEFAFRPKNFR